jgi:hypothetical protein
MSTIISFQKRHKDNFMPTISTMAEVAAEAVARAAPYFRAMSLEGEAPVQMNIAKGDVYFDAVIEGLRFQAFAGQDPYVARKDTGEWCQLGVSSIHRASPIGLRNGPMQWMVCKYSASEGRIDLHQLSDAGRRAFSITFGVPIADPHTQLRELDAFYAARAFDGLVSWAARRPRKFKAEKGISSYVGDWKSVVSARLAELKSQV